MTSAAVGLPMPAFQRELRGVVIEFRFAPTVGVMAGAALLTERAAMFIDRLVAAITLAVCVAKFLTADMTTRTL